jgi:hypothetical protein
VGIPATMRALQQTSLNGPQDLRLITDAPVPRPAPGEVLIRVTAAGVNFVDISQARGTFAGGPQPPYLAGIEGAGEVTAVGEGVTDLEPGAHVIGVGVEGGAFAEYLVLPAAAAVPVPTGWADEQALGLVVNWPTALAALKPLGGVTAGQTVLIHAAAGGTGQAAVKMAKHYGATVIAAASPGKHEDWTVGLACGLGGLIGEYLGARWQPPPAQDRAAAAARHPRHRPRHPVHSARTRLAGWGRLGGGVTAVVADLSVEPGVQRCHQLCFGGAVGDPRAVCGVGVGHVDPSGAVSQVG